MSKVIHGYLRLGDMPHTLEAVAVHLTGLFVLCEAIGITT